MRRAFPGSEIVLIVRPSSSAIVEGNPSIDSIIKLDCDSDLDSAVKRLKFIRSLAGSKFDMAVIFNPSKFFNIAAFLAGIPVRVGYDRKLGFLLTHALEDKKYLCRKHEVDYNLDLVRTVGAEAADKRLYFSLSEADEIGVQRMLAQNGIISGTAIVAVHPATSNPEKLWPIEKFAGICDRIIEKIGAKIIIVGGGEEGYIAGQVKAKMRNPPLDLTGRLSLKELGALLKRSSLLISCDSGPVHVASAVGTPVVALFGESRPGGSSKRWGPYGEGHIVIGRSKVTDITVEEVFEAVSGKLCGSR